MLWSEPLIRVILSTSTTHCKLTKDKHHCLTALVSYECLLLHSESRNVLKTHGCTRKRLMKRTSSMTCGAVEYVSITCIVKGDKKGGKDTTDSCSNLTFQ